MALIVPNEAETIMLQRILGVDVRLKLFTNDITPAETTVLADLTEASGSGYADKQLATGNWSYDFDAGDARASYSQQDFVFTGAQTLYGYYVTDNPATKILWVERFPDAPWIIPAGGGSARGTPKIKLG